MTAPERDEGVALRQRLTSKIGEMLAHARDWAQDDPPPPRDAGELAEVVVRRVVALAEALLHEAPLRRAVLDRPTLAERWPLEVHAAPLDSPEARHIDLLLVVEARDGSPWRWPANVAPATLAAALRATGDSDAVLVADALLQRGLSYIDGDRARRTGSDDDPSSSQSSPDLARARLKWPVMPCAVLMSVAIEVRAEAAAYRGTPIPATRPARAAMAAVSRGPSGPWSDLHQRPKEAALSVELVWDGKPNPFQLALAFPEDFAAQLVGGILRELQADGLRDYLLLHRMAAEQGRTGLIRWTWREHRERTAYDRRVQSKNVLDAEACAAVTARLFRLKGAELRESIRRGDRVAWRRIGPFGLIDIPAGLTADDALELAPIKLNPELYAGAATDSARPHFTLLPDAAFTLAGDRFRLAALLVLAMRDARDDGGTVRLSTAKLWEYMNLRGGEKSLPRHRWSRVDAALATALDALATAKVIGSWSREGNGPPDPQAIYRIDPRSEWRDLVVHGVPPSLPPSLASTPRTGAELRAWRDARRLTQAAAAAALGVGVATVKRAEAADSEPLGPALMRALAQTPPTE